MMLYFDHFNLLRFDSSFLKLLQVFLCQHQLSRRTVKMVEKLKKKKKRKIDKLNSIT